MKKWWANKLFLRYVQYTRYGVVFLIAVLCVAGAHLFFGTSIAKTITAKQTAPRLSNYYLSWTLDVATVKELAKWDMVVIDMENQAHNPEMIRELRRLNPDIFILAYLPAQEVYRTLRQFQGAAQMRSKLYAGIQEEWWLRAASGAHITFWPRTWMLNASVDAPPAANGQRWIDYLSSFVASEILSTDLWDGVFYDNTWDNVMFVNPDIDRLRDGRQDDWNMTNTAWKQGMQELFTMTREKYGKETLLFGNGDIFSGLNGVLLEGFPRAGWTQTMQKYQRSLDESAPPAFGLLNANTNNTGSRDDYQLVRFTYGSSLLADGYYSFDFGDWSHEQTWWYDEYDVALGKPIKAAMLVDSKMGSDDNTCTISSSVPARFLKFDIQNKNILIKADDFKLFDGTVLKDEAARGTLCAVGYALGEPFDGVETKVSDHNADGWIEYSLPSLKPGLRPYPGCEKNDTQLPFRWTLRRCGQLNDLNDGWMHFGGLDDVRLGSFAWVGFDASCVATASLAVSYDPLDKRYYASGAQASDIACAAVPPAGIQQDAPPNEFMSGIWRRDYEEGVVLVNSSRHTWKVPLGGEFEHIKGKQDTVINNGLIVDSVTLAPQDARILLRPVTELRGRLFQNGSFVRVLDASGKPARNGFFAFEKKFDGGTPLLVTDFDQGVIDEIIGIFGSEVRVYTRGYWNIRSSFYPYGEQYKGGFDLAVGDTDGDGYNEIVTVNLSGRPEVRVFSLAGETLLKGVFPFGVASGGAHIALGNTDGKPGDEIAVAERAGSRVQLLNSKGERINGFLRPFGAAYRGGLDVALGDVSGDGRAELVVVALDPKKRTVQIYDSAQLVFSSSFELPGGVRGERALDTVDIDGDGRVEIVVFGQ